jgi:hypothetical protein
MSESTMRIWDELSDEKKDTSMTIRPKRKSTPLQTYLGETGPLSQGFQAGRHSEYAI